jgi:lysozyme family protein
MSRQRFERLVGMILNHEGGYVNDPVDPGGETKYGISKRTYPYVDIKNLTVDQAKDIYYRDWWKPLRCPEIKHDRIAQKHLDTSINVGPRNGVRILQRALCDVGEAVVVDGIIGPKTLAATNRTDPDKLLATMRYQQAQFYKRIINRNPELARFERGWMNRANS